jgi:hypothetical protein
MDNVVILQCPRCYHVKEWDRDLDRAPGFCPLCKSSRPWDTLKEKPVPVKGFVRVHSSKGWQELHGPDFQEHPDAWKPYAK